MRGPLPAMPAAGAVAVAETRRRAPRPAAVLALLLGLAAAGPGAAQTAVEPGSMERRWFVQMADPGGASGATSREALGQALIETGEALVRARGGRVHRAFPTLRALAVALSSEQARDLAGQPGVERVEPEPIRRLLALNKTQLKPALANGLYGLVTTRMTEAQAANLNGLDVLVGVADSGIDCKHPDIAPALVDGINLVGAGANPSPCVGGPGISGGESHGTHVAGTIIAASNKVGVVGGAPRAGLLHARVCFGEGRGTCPTADVLEGVLWLADRGARVINLSLGGPDSSEVEREFYRQMRQRGVLVVAAAGNEAATAVTFPAAYAGVLAVGAVDVFDQLAGFSNTGAELDVVAPGVNVLSTVPRGTGSEARIKAGKVEHAGIGMAFGARTAAKGVTKKLVACGLGRPEEFPAAVKGQIALIERGEFTFAEKVANAMAAGAVAVAVFNNQAGLFSGTLGAATSPSGKAWVPVVGLSDGAGAWLLANRLNKPVTLFDTASDYALNSGTSMATPHVVAAAALVLQARPELDLDADALEQRLLETALDLGPPGRDDTFGAGRIDAFRAALE